MGTRFYEGMKGALQRTIGISFPVLGSGTECIPASGGVIIVANHQSFLDPIALGLTIPRQACFLARASLMRHPPMKWLLGGLHAIPIERDGVGKEGIKRCVACLSEGNVLVIFPEGTRTDDGQIAPFKPGIRLLLRRTNAPVVVAGIVGSYESWPRKRLLPRRRPVWIHYDSWQSPTGGDQDLLVKIRDAVIQAQQQATKALAVISSEGSLV